MAGKPTRKLLKVRGGDRLIFPHVTIDVKRRHKSGVTKLVITAEASVGIVYVPAAKVVDINQPRS